MMFTPKGDKKADLICAFIADLTGGMFAGEEASSSLAAAAFCCTEFLFFAPRFHRPATCAPEDVEYMRDTVEGCLSSILEFRLALSLRFDLHEQGVPPEIPADEEVGATVSRWMTEVLEPTADPGLRLGALFAILKAVLRFYASVFEVSFRGDFSARPEELAGIRDRPWCARLGQQDRRASVRRADHRFMM
jgi:hypothetical protein